MSYEGRGSKGTCIQCIRRRIKKTRVLISFFYLAKSLVFSQYSYNLNFHTKSRYLHNENRKQMDKIAKSLTDSDITSLANTVEGIVIVNAVSDLKNLNYDFFSD